MALVDHGGMALYAYDGDRPNVPTRTGQCAYLWPPLLAAAQVQFGGKAEIVLRADGFQQWAYAGKPLCRYAGDQYSGDAFGDGLLGEWHVIKQPWYVPLYADDQAIETAAASSPKPKSRGSHGLGRHGAH